MKPLTVAQRAQIIGALVEGTSIRGTSRMLGYSTTTILKVIRQVGEACAVYQDNHLRGLDACDEIQMDEIFTFVGSREKKKDATEHTGDTWCWIALCAKTKLRITWHVGERSHRSAYAFCGDLAQRVPENAQVTSDGLAAYRSAMAASMPLAQFAQLVKVYALDEWGNDVVVSASKMPVYGDPNPDSISTSFIEASNLHMRMANRRYARRTNAHSKKLSYHCHMLAIGFMAYNFARKHTTIKSAPAQAAGVATHQWTMEDIVAMADRYMAENLDAQFEAAFADRVTPQRTHPKSYTPTPKDQLPVPWYLNPESGGPPQE
jgi:IS1 family transposase